MKRLISLFLVCTLALSSIAYAGDIRTVALTGQQAAGAPEGANFSGFFTPVLNNAGQVAFKAALAGSGVVFENNNGIWSEGSSGLELVVRKGDHAPGTPDGVNFSVVGYFVNVPALNNAGQTAFFAQLTGSGINTTNDRGIWSEGSGSLALVAREGDHAPGTPAGVSFFTNAPLNNWPLPPALNNSGQLAFSASLTSNGVDNIGRGIWLQGSDDTTLVAGAVDSVSMNSFIPALNDAGQVAFEGSITGGSGIVLGNSGSFALLAGIGDHAPGTPDGVSFQIIEIRNFHNQPC